VIPADVAALPLGTILADPGQCGTHFHVSGCRCAGRGQARRNGHSLQVEAEECARRVLLRGVSVNGGDALLLVAPAPGGADSHGAIQRVPTSEAMPPSRRGGQGGV